MDRKTRPNSLLLAVVVAWVGLIVVCVGFKVLHLGWTPVIIVGMAGILAIPFWQRTYLQRPTAPERLLIPLLATAAGFEIHLVEEYVGHYGPAISRLFGIGWTDDWFVIIAFGLTAALSMVCLGIYTRKALAGLAASLFLFTRLAETALFAFPIIRPVVQPENVGTITAQIAGSTVSSMPNYYFHATGHYYFPGLYTVVLPIVPALLALREMWRARLTHPLPSHTCSVGEVH